MDALNIEHNVLRRPRTNATFISSLIFNCLHPLFITSATASLIIVCWKNGLNNLYTLHVLLTGLGFHLLMAAGISMLYGGNILARQMTRSSRKTVHWIVQFIGGACALIGTLIQYINREMKQKYHIVSTHSMVGTMAVILIVLSLANGVAAFFGWELRRCVKPSLMKLMHHLVGTACFAMGMYAILLAYDKHIFEDYFAWEVRIGLVVITAGTSLMSLFGVLKNVYSILYEIFAGYNSGEYIIDEIE